MPELALDDQQRDPLMGQLDGVRMAELMGREATPDSRCGGGRPSWRRAEAGSQLRPPVGPWITQNNGPTGKGTRSCCQGSSCSHPQLSIPTSRRCRLSRRGQAQPRGERQGRSRRARALRRSATRLATARRSAAQTPAIGPRPGGAHHRDDLLDGRRVCWVAAALVAGRAAGVKAGQGAGWRRWPAASRRIGCIEHLQGAKRSRGRHDDGQPRRALTLRCRGDRRPRRGPKAGPGRQGARTPGCLCRVASAARPPSPCRPGSSPGPSDRNVAEAEAPRDDRPKTKGVARTARSPARAPVPTAVVLRWAISVGRIAAFDGRQQPGPERCWVTTGMRR